MATDRLVVDASSAIRASVTDGWRALGRWDLVAPSLMWSEAAAGLAQLRYRSDLTAEETAAALGRLLAAQITMVPSRELITEALDLSRTLGWAKTYDAEFVVLALRLEIPLLTLDARLAASARRFVTVIPEA